MAIDREIYDEVVKFTRIIDTAYVAGNRLYDIDKRMLNPKYWKTDSQGNLTNTWCRLYIDRGQRTGTPYVSDEEDFIPMESSKTFFGDVLIFGVAISISKTPTIIQTPVKGLSNPVIQKISSNTYNIEIGFVESGPVFWQQNSHNIVRLLNVLNSNEPIKIYNPQLDTIFKIRDIAVTNYNIGQNPSFYAHNDISISLVSTTNDDLIQRTIDTIDNVITEKITV